MDGQDSSLKKYKTYGDLAQAAETSAQQCFRDLIKQMESDFARGESVNKAEIAHLREKVEKLKQGFRDALQNKVDDPTQNLMVLMANG